MMDIEQLAAGMMQLLTGEESEAELEDIIRGAIANSPELDGISVSELVEAVQAMRSTDVALPHLLVDWKTLPSIGSQCTPSFLLVLSDAFKGLKPEVTLGFSPHIDSAPGALRPELSKTQEGHYDWFFPFSLTQNDVNCRPGDYVLTILVRFRGATLANVPSRLKATVRLTVPDPDQSSGEQVLEIDADGKSIVNLQGMDLARFGRVKLTGSDAAIINALNTVEQESAETGAEDNSNEPASVVHEYVLKPDYRYEFDSFHLSNLFQSGSRIKEATIQHGERNFVLFTQRQLRVGRSRDADLVTRFLPRSEENDTSSKKLSRVHVILEVGEDGLQITNRSSSGFEWNLQSHTNDDRATLEKERLNEPCDLGLGEILGSQLKLVVTPIANSMSSGLIERVEEFADRQHLRTNPMWRLSKSNNWECIHIERENNLTEEEYVILCRTILIGSSSKLCGIAIPGLPTVAARLLHLNNMFYLSPYDESCEITIDGERIQANEQAALSTGQSIGINDVSLMFNEYSQLYM